MIKTNLKSIFSIFLLLNVIILNAQNVKDLKMKNVDSVSYKSYIYLTKQFETARPLNIEYTFTGPSDFSSNTRDVINDNNKLNYNSLLKVSSNINIYKKKSVIINTTIGYKNTVIDLDLANNENQDKKSIYINANYFFQSLNFAYNTKLFNKHTFFTSSFIIDGSDKHFGRAKAFLTGSILLKNTDKTKIIAGIAVNIDESSNTPVIPMFALQHRLLNGSSIDLILPKHIFYRLHLFKKSRLSIGAELEANSFYLNKYFSNSNSKIQEYKQVDLNTGLKYEFLLTDNIILMSRIGAKTVVRNGMFTKGDKFNDSYFSSSQNALFYFNIGISYNPFVKNKK